MSRIGVDQHTYEIMYQRTYAECLHRHQGDTTEARKLAQYYLRDWYVVTDGDPELIAMEIDEIASGRFRFGE